LAVVIVLNVTKPSQAGFPFIPSAATFAAGLAAGAALVLVGRFISWVPDPAGWTAAAVAVIAAVALSPAAGGYTLRHAKLNQADANVVRWFDRLPGFADGREPVTSAALGTGMLTGDRLRHPLELLAERPSCRSVLRSTERGWLVVFQIAAVHQFNDIALRVRRCLAGRLRPVFFDASHQVYTSMRSP